MTRRRGAAIIEFALIVPILLAMLLGIVEFAWLARNHLTLANASREGARAAAVGKTTTEIRNRIYSMASVLPQINTRLTINLQKDDNPADGYSYNTLLGDSAGKNNAAIGGMVRVQLVYRHQSITNFFPFMNKTITLDTVMRREG
jgi:Flp pilus assembly protein TadG